MQKHRAVDVSYYRSFKGSVPLQSRYLLTKVNTVELKKSWQKSSIFLLNFNLKSSDEKNSITKMNACYFFGKVIDSKILFCSLVFWDSLFHRASIYSCLEKTKTVANNLFHLIQSVIVNDSFYARLYFPQMCIMKTAAINSKEITKTGTGPI